MHNSTMTTKQDTSAVTKENSVIEVVGKVKTRPGPLKKLTRGDDSDSDEGRVSSSVSSETGSPIENELEDLWRNTAVESWGDAVAGQSIFQDLYPYTIARVERELKTGKYTCLIEVGSGTGDVIGKVKTHLPRYGVDINPDFVEVSSKRYANDLCSFHEGDATKLNAWWEGQCVKEGKDVTQEKPFVICTNNTINIVPSFIRPDLLAQMRITAGVSGRCMVTYWNGKYFPLGVMGFYKKHPELCGAFDEDKHVDFEKRRIVTPSGYESTWNNVQEVRNSLMSNDIIATIGEEHSPVNNLIYEKGLGIFAFFDHTSATGAKEYYDSEISQMFYKKVWGTGTVHLGRYDLLTEEDKTMSLRHQIDRAQEVSEKNMIQKVKDVVGDEVPIRLLDMGCGYGGPLRRFVSECNVWRAVGVDISSSMCEHAIQLNKREGVRDGAIDFRVESFVRTSVADESQDVVISTDALLHVGRDMQADVVKEMYRVLRPGGWVVFTDIMETEGADKAKMDVIHARMGLHDLGTVEHYQTLANTYGFGNFEYEDMSSNVAVHYSNIRQVLNDTWKDLGMSQTGVERILQGLQSWSDIAPGNIAWGIFRMQKQRSLTPN